MWEFALNITSKHQKISEKLKTLLTQYFELSNCILTTSEENNFLKILIAVDDKMEEYAKKVITSAVIEIICDDFKEIYLNKYLLFNMHDTIEMCAFKKALVNFDRETDRFIIRKNLELKKDLFLESFFRFKLKSLQNKWSELVSLANENREYLFSNSSFIELLKFLVDNLDICEDEISVIKEDGGYRIFTSNAMYSNSVFNEENIVSSIIDLSPQKINLYFNEKSSAINLLEQIFDERITKNKLSFKNVEKFKLNM